MLLYPFQNSSNQCLEATVLAAINSIFIPVVNTTFCDFVVLLSSQSSKSGYVLQYSHLPETVKFLCANPIIITHFSVTFARIASFVDLSIYY